MAKTKSNKEEKVQVHSVWCPSCGIPRNASMPLKKYLRQKTKLKFECFSCKLKVTIMLPQKEKPPKPEKDFTMKDLKTAKTLIKMVGGK